VHATQLSHRVVAVLDKDPLIELVGTVESDGRVDRSVAREIEVATNSSRKSRRRLLEDLE